MVLLVLVVLRGSLVLLVGFPVLLPAKSPAIGTTCGNLGVRVKSERMDERDTKN